MEYKTVLLSTQYKDNIASCIAELDAVINDFVRAGWEFVRLETRHVYKKLTKGAKFMGKEEIIEPIDIAVFKRESEGEAAVSIPFVAAKVDQIAGKMDDISAKVDDIGKTTSGIANAADGIISTTDALVANIVEEKTVPAREYERRPPVRDDRNFDSREQSYREPPAYREQNYRDSRPGYPSHCQNEKDCPVVRDRDYEQRRAYPDTREYDRPERPERQAFQDRERYERPPVNREREPERDEVRPFPKKLF